MRYSSKRLIFTQSKDTEDHQMDMEFEQAKNVQENSKINRIESLRLPIWKNILYFASCFASGGIFYLFCIWNVKL
jgi:hypothetical protein